MLTEILQYLRNWFRRSVYVGTIVIEEGTIKSINGEDAEGLFRDGQYCRILGSALNDGVYQQTTSELHDETFNGAVWGLGIPHAVLALVEDIEDWQAQNGAVAAGPYQSESFGGYSYSKATSASNGDTSWQSAFASRLAPWRKI